MYQKNEFVITAAQEKLATLKGKFEFPANGNIEEVNDIIEKVLFSMQIHSGAKYVLTRSLYPTAEGSNVLDNARFTLRPSVSHTLEVAELKKIFTLNAGEDFFDKFIDEFAIWFDEWQYHKQLQVNLDALNGKIYEVIEENEIPFGIRFSLGAELIDTTDTFAIIGLEASVIEDISSLPLFDQVLEARQVGYKNTIAEVLKEISKPYELVKVKAKFAKNDLGIYSRRAIHKLIREFVNRKIEHTRTGVGYYETDETFAVVEKTALTSTEVDQFDLSAALVLDNSNASEKEKEAGKTKILVTFRVSPFNKEDGTPVELSLEDALKPVPEKVAQ